MFSSLLYILLILLFDCKIFLRIYQCGFNTIVASDRTDKDDNEDPDIGMERDKVNDAKNQSGDYNYSSINFLQVNYSIY